MCKVTNKDLDTVAKNLKVKMVDQTLFYSKVDGLGMRRAGKNPPRGSVYLGILAKPHKHTDIKQVVLSMLKDNGIEVVTVYGN